MTKQQCFYANFPFSNKWLSQASLIYVVSIKLKQEASLIITWFAAVFDHINFPHSSILNF